MHKKNSRYTSKQSEFLTKRDFFFEISDTETCDNPKKLFDHSQFSFDSHIDNYKPQRVNKKNQSNDNIFEFHNCHKIFSYKRIELFVIEKSEYNVQTVKIFVKINQFYEIKTAHIE